MKPGRSVQPRSPLHPIRIAVIGAGYMGALHAEKVDALGRSEGSVALTGVSDIDGSRAREVARRTHTRAVTDYRELLRNADAVIVAVPTLAHFRVVLDALSAGLHVLVEKPIAASLSEAEKLLSAARDQGRVLQVGHLEWFNAAMRRVESAVHRPRFFEAHRMGPFPGRATDVDVIRDLMIHDVDIVQRLLGEEPARIEAVGVPVLSNEVDIANARLTFPSGCVANLTASRVSPTPLRKIRFFQIDGYFSIDFLEQSVVIARRVVAEEGSEVEIDVQRIEIDGGDALLSQLRAFVKAVCNHDASAGLADEALSALRTALRIVASVPPIDELR